jgi:RNA polymerase sigma-70 factor (ECF subfamily)
MPAGDKFHDFYRGAYPRLVAQLYAVTADLALAEDLVQEAFVRAASRWPQVGAYQAPEAWVRKVALRLRLDALRRVRRQARALARLEARPRPEPALGLEDRELVEALRRLPGRYREVLVLHHCLDRSVDDVAACLGIPAATVKTRLARGRAKLVVLLDGAEPPSEEGSRHVRS